MAKKKNSTNDSVTETTTELPTTVVYGDWSAIVADLSPKAVSYLLQNGFSQSMTDAAAFSKADKEGKTEDEITAMAKEARQKRYDAILAGTVGHRVGGGPKMSSLEKVCRDVARERLKAAAVSKGVKLPKGEALTALIEKMVNGKHADTIKAEAQTRIDNAKAGADDVEGLLD